MANDLVLDAQLSKDSYAVGNSSEGAIAGWERMKVSRYILPTGSNFSGQLYKGPDGSYRIAFRGTAGVLDPGDVEMNKAIVTGNWSAEMSESVKFAYYAIKEIQALNGGISFESAAKKLSVTGHSQGAFEAELNAMFFTLNGTSFDGPGASYVSDTQGWRDMQAWVRAQEPDAKLGGGVGDFTARRYTALIGGTGVHADGVRVDNSIASLILQFGSMITRVGASASLAMQATVLHSIDSIIELEVLRSKSTLLQKIVNIDDAESADSLAFSLSEEWAFIQISDVGGTVSADQIEILLKTFLNEHNGQAVTVQQIDRTVSLGTANGDGLLLLADGSGQMLTTQGLTLVHVQFAKGGEVVAQNTLQRDDDGNTLLTHKSATLSGTQTIDPMGKVLSAYFRETGADGQLISETVASFGDGNSTTTVKTFGLDHALLLESATQVFDDGSRIETLTSASGVQTRYFDSDGMLVSSDESSGPQGSATLINTIGQASGTLIDALSLMRAIQTGQPLPIAASGLRLANSASTMAGNPNTHLAGAANITSGLMSLMSLDAALKRGDTFAALTASAHAINFGATAYANFNGFIDNGSGSAVAQAFGADSAFTSLNESLPYLNLVAAIVEGDEVGVAVAVISMIPGMQWLAPAYAIFDMIGSLFGGDDIPDPWGQGRFTWQGERMHFEAAGETGGQEAVSAVLNSVLTTMNALIEREREQNPGSMLGVIPNRMPDLGYDMRGYRYSAIDPLTGGERHAGLRFDTDGRPYNAEPGSPESFQSLVEAMVRSASMRSAIAPLWEVDTARLQTQAGDPRAGLTEEERAARDGLLAAPLVGSTQHFRPVVLDLDGDGIDITPHDEGVAFNVDDTGYLKQTAWVGSDDAFLVLDRDLNGTFDSGREMFANATVALARRGMGGMGWVDANYDGRLSSADPVWGELRLWRDLDGDGAQDAGEVFSLDVLGVTELNYAMGTYTADGQVRQMASPDLLADREGTRVSVIDEGILVQTSENGRLSLLVTRIDDKTAVEANRDGVAGFEDIEIIIDGAQLTANDLLGGINGRPLLVTGLANFRHGSGFVDANGFVHFLPEPDYAGGDAGFDYVALAENGQQASGSVDVVLEGVNDAPRLGETIIESRPVYNYTPAIKYGDSFAFDPYIQGGVAIFEPYGLRPIYHDESAVEKVILPYPEPGEYDVEYFTVPIATEATGRVVVRGMDVDDDAASLQVELLNQPQYGAVSVNADGSFHYTSWKQPGVPSDFTVVEGNYAANYEGAMYYAGYLIPPAINPTSDVFQVRITDPHGASSIASVTVPHYGPYLPPTPPPGRSGGLFPIAVDLGDNGFDFVDIDDGNVFFDINGDGWRRRTAWVGPDDGLLAYDIDGDGQIDQGAEIGFVGYSDTAETDLQGLAAFDSNGDGVFDASDDKWSRFGIWRDANQDGVSDAGEFKSLASLGVRTISLTSDGRFQVIDGQTVHGVGALTLDDGTTLALADVTLATGRDALSPTGVQLPGGASPFAPPGEILAGTPGKDLLLGRHGDTVIKAGDSDDVVFEDGGNDHIDTGDGNDVVYAGTDRDLVLAGAGNDVVFAGWGDDLLFGGEGADALLAEGGNDVVFGGAGNDFIAGGTGNDVLSGDAGDDVIYGEAGNDALFGMDGDDALSGMDGADYLDGGAGNDVLDGGAGNDRMAGGVGDDLYVLDDERDSVVEEAGAGNDTVTLSPRTAEGFIPGAASDADSAPAPAPFTSGSPYRLGDHLENLVLGGTAPLQGRGNALDNRITGNAGDNHLFGEAGKDFLDGGAGRDYLAGGTGDDVYAVDNLQDAVVELAGEGIDSVLASVTTTLASAVENLTLTGAAAIDGSGNELANTLLGNAAANRLDGGTGADMLQGGDGDDTYLVDDPQDRVVEYAGEGKDLAISGISHALEDHVESLLLSGTAKLVGRGNAADNSLTGNSGDNLLVGGLGNDTLLGAAGDDTLDGGSGKDVLNGGSGDDIYLFNPADGLDLIIDAAGLDTVRFSTAPGPQLPATLDTVAVRIDTSTAQAVAQLRMLDENGNEQADQGFDFVLTQDAGGKFIAPIERFALSDGSVRDFDDLLIRTQVVAAPKKGGIISGRHDDIIQAGPQNNLVRAGSGNDTVTGSVRADALYGEGGHDHLSGGNGNDTIDGGWGNDVLSGGNGHDLLRDLHGNNAFLGGMQQDRIEAGDGNDFIAGGKHNDVIHTGGGANVIAFNRGDGADTLVSAAGSSNTISLGAGISEVDLWFSRSGPDLKFHLNAGEYLSLKDWYVATDQRGVHYLQLIGSPPGHAGPGGANAPGQSAAQAAQAVADAAVDDAIRRFDFTALVQQYDAFVKDKPGTGMWSLAQSMPSARLATGTDTAPDGTTDLATMDDARTVDSAFSDAALGSELASSYALHGRLPGTITGIASLLSDPGFGAPLPSAAMAMMGDERKP